MAWPCSGSAADCEELVTVSDAVDRDLAELEARKPGLSLSSLAATARALAKALDEPRAATAISLNSKELRETMQALNELAPAVRASNPLDEIRQRRETKRARQAAAKN